MPTLPQNGRNFLGEGAIETPLLKTWIHVRQNQDEGDCKQFQNSLICYSSEKVDESVQFSAGQTSFSLMCMITPKNC